MNLPAAPCFYYGKRFLEACAKEGLQIPATYIDDEFEAAIVAAAKTIKNRQERRKEERRKTRTQYA